MYFSYYTNTYTPLRHDTPKRDAVLSQKNTAGGWGRGILGGGGSGGQRAQAPLAAESKEGAANWRGGGAKLIL